MLEIVHDYIPYISLVEIALFFIVIVSYSLLAATLLFMSPMNPKYIWSLLAIEGNVIYTANSVESAFHIFNYINFLYLTLKIILKYQKLLVFNT